jgi:serine/threonine-protein kinase RsbT
MASRDSSSAAVEVLSRYFSPPLASTLLNITLRREQLAASELGTAGANRLADALERTLPSYLGEPEKRKACVAELRRVLASAEASAQRANGVGFQRCGDFPILREGDLHDLTETLRALLRDIGFSALDQTKFLTASSELVRNILQYARTGQVSVSRATRAANERAGLELVASDNGPGIADIGHVLSAQYRSKSGMGIGLKGARRLVDEFELDSQPGRGTRVTIRKYV